MTMMTKTVTMMVMTTDDEVNSDHDDDAQDY
jgi:hypothetical protein